MITDDAERTMNTALAITSDFSTEELNPAAIADAKYLFIEGYLASSPSGTEAAIHAKQLAEGNDTKVALTFSDPSMVLYFKDQMKSIVGSGLDLLFCNEEEAIAFTDAESIEEARERLKSLFKQFVITQGKNGAMIWDGETFVDIEPYPIQAVDSTGAGDMFAGSFLYAITNGHTCASAGRLASKLSSFVVGQYGPRLEKDELLSIKNELFTSN